ncbi:MAG: RNA ligase RtcB family protein [Verrucomicrobia subdivision 3 bacterium]|nr:RNA ligase RtcB family protein [Limisphaerales bacterium]
MNTSTETQVRLFASAQSWIEGEAVRQLYATAKLDGIRHAVGFPDLHPGKGSPVGAAFMTEGVIYPHLIGGDIGCGMALFKTDLVRRDAKLDRWARLPFNLEHPWEQFVSDFLAEHDLESTEFDAALGTIGGGNHFAELQTVEQVLDVAAFKKLGLGKQQLVVLVHSGSRGLGESILRAHVDQHFGEGVEAESFAAEEYLRGHDFAVRWAKTNRELIARRFAATLGAEAECLWDGCHNSITRQEAGWIHRKGAVAADGDFVLIPGSRGTLSYLVKPIGDGESHAWSLAHGAGRKWARSDARQRMRERFGMHQLVQTPLGGRVICEERDLLYEEAPAAYKNIEAVVHDLVAAGLVSVIATLRPLLTYKTRKLRR